MSDMDGLNVVVQVVGGMKPMFIRMVNLSGLIIDGPSNVRPVTSSSNSFRISL